MTRISHNRIGVGRTTPHRPTQRAATDGGRRPSKPKHGAKHHNDSSTGAGLLSPAKGTTKPKPEQVKDISSDHKGIGENDAGFRRN